VPVPVARFRSLRLFLWAGLAALAFAGFSGWLALLWPYAAIAAVLFLLSAVFFLFLASRPPLDVFDSHLQIGRNSVPWMQIRRVDRSANLPLIVRLTMADKSRILIVHSGDAESGKSLLRHLRRFSREALIDGVPYRQFWGEPLTVSAAPERKALPQPRYPLLMAEDEAEVERLFQRLKTVGHLDQRGSSEEK
jgi:hypothetical protein